MSAPGLTFALGRCTTRSSVSLSALPSGGHSQACFPRLELVVIKVPAIVPPLRGEAVSSEEGELLCCTPGVLLSRWTCAAAAAAPPLFVLLLRTSGEEVTSQCASRGSASTVGAEDECSSGI